MRSAFDGNFIAKQPSNTDEILVYERLLAEGLRDFLQELTMVDGGLILSCVCRGQHANLNDIIGSSTEFTVKPGRLTYGNDAEVEFDWGAAPSVSLAIELRDDRLTAFFRVVFGGDFIGVDIRGIHFADEDVGAEAKLRRFADSVADIRLRAADRKPVSSAGAN